MGAFSIRNSYSDVTFNIKAKDENITTNISVLGCNGYFYSYNSAFKINYNIENGKTKNYIPNSFYKSYVIVENDSDYKPTGESILTSSDNEQILNIISLPSNWINIKDEWFYIKNEEEIFSVLQGKGTEQDPYLLKTYDDLFYMHISSKNLWFKLNNDIDCQNKDNVSLRRILTNVKINLDGNNKTIKNLNGSGFQIFYELTNSYIKDLTIDNLNYQYSDDFLYESTTLFENVVNTTLENVNIKVNYTSALSEENNLNLYLFKNAFKLNLNNIIFSLNVNSNTNFKVKLFYQIKQSDLNDLTFNLDVTKSLNSVLDFIESTNEDNQFKDCKIDVTSSNPIGLSVHITNSGLLQNQLQIMENNSLIYPTNA